MSAAVNLSAREGRCERLSRARLYLISNCRPAGGSLEQLLNAALSAGVDIVQLRDKEATPSELIVAASKTRDLCSEHGALLIVNDSPQLALTCAADGVHLGQEDMALTTARKIVGEDILIGHSTHSQEQIELAGEGGLCDYIGVGPVFATPTKPTYEPVGLELVRFAAERATLPFFAIGGINSSNIGQVINAGAERVAVVRAVTEARNPAAAASELLQSVTEGDR